MLSPVLRPTFPKLSHAPGLAKAASLSLHCYLSSPLTTHPLPVKLYFLYIKHVITPVNTEQQSPSFPPSSSEFQFLKAQCSSSSPHSKFGTRWRTQRLHFQVQWSSAALHTKYRPPQVRVRAFALPFSELSAVRPILLLGPLHLRAPLTIPVPGVLDIDGHPFQIPSSAKTCATIRNTSHPLELVADPWRLVWVSLPIVRLPGSLPHYPPCRQGFWWVGNF